MRLHGAEDIGSSPIVYTNKKKRDNIMRKYEIDINFKKDLSKVIQSKACFHEKDRCSSAFICNLMMDNRPIDITDCQVYADVMVNEGDYKTAVCLETLVLDASMGKVAFGLSEELMVAGVKRFQVHINHGIQVIHSPMVEYTIFKGL